MSITRDFKLSLVAGRSVPLVINANQYDDGEIWRFTLLDENGQKYSPSTGSIIGLKSDGHIIANAGTVSSTGLVIIAETEQMTAAVGKNFYELLIDDDTHGTANFIVFVEPRPGAGGTPSDSDLAVFQEAIDAAATIGDVVDLVDDVAVLEARMDEFTTLTEGSTTGDAELADIRVGADGTTYPNAGDAVRGQVSDLKNAIMHDNYESVVENVTNKFEAGTIALSNVGIGNVVDTTVNTSVNFIHQIVESKKGDSILLTGQGGETPRLWGITDADYKLLSVSNVSVSETDLTLVAPEDGYFIVNVNKNYPYSLVTTSAVPKVDLLNDELTDLNNNIDVIELNITSLYENQTSDEIKNSENLIPDDAVKYSNSKCEGLTPSYIPSIIAGNSFLVDFEIPTNVKKIWCKKFTNLGQMLLLYKENVSGVNYTKTTAVDNTLIINNDNYIVIDCSVALSRGFERVMLSFDSEKDSGIYEYKGILNVKQNLDYVTPLTGLNMFDSIACLGDSYTQGFIVKSDTSATIAKKPYPTVLHDKLGITVDNYGVGGTTSKTYITHTQGLPRVLADNAHDLYIICFGINDQGQNMTIGNASDINDEDYTQNSDSFYGNMGKIIQMLKEQFPLARYVIIGNWATGLWYSAYNPYNVASKGIAEHFNIPYVNPMDDPFFYSDIFINDVGGHPTQVGYTGIAYAVERLMAKCIAENYAYYKYAGIEEA